MQREKIRKANGDPSSSLESVGYDDQTGTLEVAFHGGAVYQYANVHRSLYLELRNAPSPGGYFARRIKTDSRYPAKLISHPAIPALPPDVDANREAAMERPTATGSVLLAGFERESKRQQNALFYGLDALAHLLNEAVQELRRQTALLQDISERQARLEVQTAAHIANIERELARQEAQGWPHK